MQQATQPLFCGWLTKLGAVRKNWKRRWFVVSPDYSVAYYAGSRDNRGAAKGELILQGYEVRADCFKAEKDLCIELYHRKRRCFYVFADNREDYEQWMPILKEACRKARYPMHPDAVRARVFDVAFKATQEMMEVPTDRLPEVSEADALTELVCDMIHHIVLTDAFADDPHSSQHSSRFASLTSKTVLAKRIEMKVGAEVATALQAINDEAEHLRRRVKPQLRACWPAFARAQDDLNERIEEAVQPVVQPGEILILSRFDLANCCCCVFSKNVPTAALNRMVKPSVRRILNVIIPVIAEAYVRVLAAFHEASLGAVNTIASSGMDRAAEIVAELSRSVAGTVRHTAHPLHGIVETVERLITPFDEGVTEVLEEDGIVVHADAIVDTVLAALQTAMALAVSVFAEEINGHRSRTTDLQPAVGDLHRLHQRSVNALHHDCHASMATLIGTITKDMVLPPYLQQVAVPAHELVARNVCVCTELCGVFQHFSLCVSAQAHCCKARPVSGAGRAGGRGRGDPGDARCQEDDADEDRRPGSRADPDAGGGGVRVAAHRQPRRGRVRHLPGQGAGRGDGGAAAGGATAAAAAAARRAGGGAGAAARGRRVGLGRRRGGAAVWHG